MKWLAFAAIVGCWLFGLGMRAAWADANEVPDGTFRGKPLLTTPDAYFYAAGVQHEVADTLGANRRVPGAGDSVLVALAGGIVGAFGAPIEDVCFWLPAFLAPLVAVPLVLLGLLFRRLAWGTLAALIAVLGFSYWNRTVPGYFDTDMLAVPFVTAVAALVVAGLWRRRARLGAVAALLTAISPWIHPGSERVIAALGVCVLGYAFVFDRREPSAYRIALMLFVALLPIPWWARMLLVLVLELGLPPLRLRPWALATLAVLGAATFAALTLLGPTIYTLLTNLGHEGPPRLLSVSFAPIGETVLELTNPTLAALAERISGHPWLLVSGALGYLAACWRHRPLLMLLPLLGVGVVLALSGLRYTIFAVPVVALGNAWLALAVAALVARRVRWRPRVIEAATATALGAAMVVSAGRQALALPPSGALASGEAELMSALAPQIAPGDVLITWWDYAYGAWYYSGADTIIDGAKQDEDLWLVAEILFTRSQREAAALARLAAEQHAVQPPLAPVIDDMIAAWQGQGGAVADLVPALREGRVALPPPSRQVFLYIPWRILGIAPNIASKRAARGLLPKAELAGSDAIVLAPLPSGAAQGSGGWKYDLASQVIVSQRGERVPVNTVAEVTTDARGGIRTRHAVAHPEGRAFIVNLRDRGASWMMDQALYESVLTQLLFLARPDPSCFELTLATQAGVIYRVRP